MQDGFIKLTEAARRANLSVRTLKKHISSGEIPYYQPTGRLILVKWSEVSEWIERSRRDALADPYVQKIILKMAEAGAY